MKTIKVNVVNNSKSGKIVKSHTSKVISSSKAGNRLPPSTKQRVTCIAERPTVKPSLLKLAGE